MADPTLDPVTVDNSVLLLVDYQRTMFYGIGSGDRNDIMNNTVGVAKGAQILGVPVVLTSIQPEGNGEFVRQITDLFAGQKVFARTPPAFDALEDAAVAAAVRESGHRKLIVAGLWTSICMAFTALHGLRDGLEVYGVIDAAGDDTVDAHAYGVERMVQAGVVPITTMAVVSEWMHDWANPTAVDLNREFYSRQVVIFTM